MLRKPAFRRALALAHRPKAIAPRNAGPQSIQVRWLAHTTFCVTTLHSLCNVVAQGLLLGGQQGSRAGSPVAIYSLQDVRNEFLEIVPECPENT